MSISGNAAAEKLRTMINTPGKVVIAPGVYDGLSARMALSQKFEALYMSGAGVSMSKLGYADLGMATFDDMAAVAGMMANLDPSVPLIADADTGYGGPIMVARTVKTYARAGVAALHLEDQVQEKRCGQLIGKQIVDKEIWYSRLRSAIDARNSIGSKMLIIARTDVRESQGFDEAIERLKGAAALGVDVLFFEALQSHDEARKACELLRGTPILLNMVAGGVTPTTSAAQAAEMGFSLMIFPGACIYMAVQGALESLRDLKATGRQLPGQGESPKSIFNMCGLEECIGIDKIAQGAASVYNKI